MQECELENFLEQHPELIEEGLRVIQRQKKIDRGVIDLFCQDKNEKYVVIEIKLKPTNAAIAQIAKYLLSLQKQGIAKGKLRGILVTAMIDEEIQRLCNYFNIETKELTISESKIASINFADLEDGYIIDLDESERREEQVYILIKEKDLTSAEARMLIAILRFNDYCSYPTHEDLSKVTNMSKNAVRSHLSSISAK